MAPLDGAEPDSGRVSPPPRADAEVFSDVAQADVVADDGGPEPRVPCTAGCDDGDACTADACDRDGWCVHLAFDCTDDDPCTADGCDPMAGCFHEPFDCDDGNPCTVDTCWGQGECSNEAIDCDDGNACTDDVCADGTCIQVPRVCDDGDPCTVDACDPQQGCVVDPTLSVCCTGNADCDDGLACTEDWCDETGTCQHAVVDDSGNCCMTAADCGEPGPCIEPVCAASLCLWQPKPGPGCCQSDAECDDGDPCTFDRCGPGYACVHDMLCCQADADCDDLDDTCTEDLCVDGVCLHPTTGAPGCCTPTIASVDFEDGDAGGFVFDNASEQTTGVGWRVAQSPDTPSGTWALYFGNALASGYAAGTEVPKGTAQGPAWTLPAGVDIALTFLLDLDVQLGTYNDRLYVRVVPDESPEDAEAQAPKPVTVWSKKNVFTQSTWFPVTIDLTAWAGQTIHVEFAFDAFVPPTYAGTGVWIDDIELLSSCQPRTCDSDEACDDGLGATVDTCLDGFCHYDASLEACATHDDCDNGSNCTADYCDELTLTCIHQDLGTCCTVDADCIDTFVCTQDTCVTTGPEPYCGHVWDTFCCDNTEDGTPLFCDDNNPCTIDSCPEPGGTCVNEPIPGCCVTDADCDDGSDCTADVCAGGMCQHLDFCCATDADCDNGDAACTSAHCDQGTCNYEFVGGLGCCTVSLVEDDFDAGAPVAFEQIFNPTQDEALWLPSTEQAHSPPYAMWFGNPDTGTYEDEGGRVWGTLRSVTPFDVPLLGFTWVDLWFYLANEYSAGGYPNADFDRLRVQFRPVIEGDEPAGDETVTVLWDSAQLDPPWWVPGPDGKPVAPKWTHLSFVDLAPVAGQRGYLEIVFDTLDGWSNAFPGVWVDDVRVRQTCTPAAPLP